ncbi:MAG: selenocysteine-specific translation elongation factor [Candidatus Eremiobacteraeota bacterium]|nr:selenocysteine-specific translation elongation factor [Candidatus Eremiobacteraeota bacterium]
MHIIGTAGHVDHGKSSLVRALTGTDPDRWIEEQLRGMTLDLGFAHLRLDGGAEAGIVDVPGHERFLHNMLAGAAGMELLMLVVAANEGVMPQTREHLAILRYLNVGGSLIVVTKTDLLEPAALESAIGRIRADLAGTIAASAPLLPVSTRTGAGFEQLRAALLRELKRLPERGAQAPAFLPIDRVFALAGRGTIVTGTLMQGTLRVGDAVQVAPQGLQSRVRGLHVFGTPHQSVRAGARVAVNLPGIENSQVARGDVLADPQFTGTSQLAVTFTPLPDGLPLLRRRNPVRVYLGSAEILATLVFETVPEQPTAHGGVLYLRRPAVTYPNANFVVRRMSPKTLLGGGVIAGAERAVEAPELIAGAEAICSVLASAGLEPLTVAQIAARANLRESEAAQALQELVAQRRVFAIAKPLGYLDAGAAHNILERLTATLQIKLQETPWVLGVTSLALARALSMPEDFLIRMCAAFADDGDIAARAGYYATSDHVAKLSGSQREFFEKQLSIDAQNALLPVPLSELIAAVRTAPIPGLSQAFDTLVARGAIVKVGEDVYRGTQIASIHARVEEFLHAEKQITMAQFRDLIGTSRKFAVPLLEWFDARGITIRSGDVRTLRKK